MVDNVNPTNQFHPYQPETSTPHAERPKSGLGSILSKLGVDGSKLGGVVNNPNLRGSVDKARNYARNNGSMVLGGLAALVIGAGLLRKRSMSGSRSAGF